MVYVYIWVSQVSLVVKNQPCNAEDVRGKRHELDPEEDMATQSSQYSCLENLMDRAAWRTIVHGFAMSQTWLKQFSIHACTHVFVPSTRRCLLFRFSKNSVQRR